jgi:phage tail-like protein
MPDSLILASDKFIAPWQTFKFHVAFVREPIAARGGGSGASGDEALCEGGFSDVSGLEASMEAKAIKEGGANYGAHQRAGQVTFATVILKRGMSSSRDLWGWWALFAGAGNPGGGSGAATRTNGAFAHRLTVRITLMNAAAQAQLVWRLERAMPVKFKAADFNARATEVGIEELHLVHEGLFVEMPQAAAGNAAPAATGAAR